MTNPMSKKKQAISRKLFKQLTVKQACHSGSALDKVLRNMYYNLDSRLPELEKEGTKVFMGLFNNLMPRESSPLVSIDNSKTLNIGGKGGLEVIQSLADFMTDRAQKIEKLESREVEVSSAPEQKKLPANSPVNPG